jgi:hypothetical protein
LASIVLLFIVLTPVVSANDRVIINSGNWIDVYSGMLYAQHSGKQSNFLTSTRHSTIIANSLPASTQSIEIISSRTSPFITGYTSVLNSRGFNDVEELRSTNANLELLSRLPNINKFIIVDSTYGYNAVSVAPLAVIGDYYVIFANANNINQVMNALNSRTVSEVIIYGQTAREVRSALEEFDPTIINTGDRFDNNIQIVERFQQIYRSINGEPRKQAILTNGEFLEASIFTGADPVLFIGFANVPTQVQAYIDRSDLEVGTLVGNELIGTATFIRRQTGLSVFVKFGQGARTPTGAISQVEDLDRFPIPRFDLDLRIVAAQINTATNTLEVTYQNNAPVATYFRNILLRLTIDGTSSIIPDEIPNTFIDGNSFKTMVYPLIDGDGQPINPSGSDKELEINTIYGESPRSLEQTLQYTLKVEEIRVSDESNIEIVDLVFHNRRQGFLIDVRNIAEVDTYVLLELVELEVDGEILTFSSETPTRIRPGRTSTIYVQTTLEEEDVVNNQNIRVRAYYGERENSLIKIKEAVFEFKYAGFDFTYFILVILIILLILLIAYRKKCRHCGYKNPAVRKTCKKCHRKL